MTYEELKKLANEMGYDLIPRIHREKLIPCMCGSNRRTRVFVYNHKQYYRCNRCGYEAPPGRNEQEMRDNWNKAMKEETCDS